MKKLKITKQNGITLIALVVTIIVLLILAGVTISLVLGENGIIAKAKKTQSVTDEASAKEAVELAVGYVQSEAYTSNLTREEIRAKLEQELQKTDANATAIINGDRYTGTYKGYEFEIDSNFYVTIKQPFNAAEWDKTAAPETCFQWESDNPEDGEAYHTIIGWTEEIQTLVKVRIPSRCTKIITDQYGSDESIGRAFVQNIQTVELPETIIEIGHGAFGSINNLSFKSMTEINIPSSVTSIGYMAFRGCTGLTNITIPNSITSIGGYAFYYCTGLTSITIPDSVTSIGGIAFHNTAWYNNQPDGVVYAGKVAYDYKGTMPSDTSIELKEGTKGIANTAFADCTGLTNIKIPDSVTSIGENAFHNTAWYNNQPDGVVCI